MIRLAWRMVWRELRAGELRLLFAALCVAVAAVTSVGFLGERIGKALEFQGRQMMGGDLVLASDRPIAPALFDEAARLGLRSAQTLVFPSMVMADGRAQLVEIKAVSAAYPLHGRLALAGNSASPARVESGAPAAGQVFVDERLQAALALSPGGSLTVGRLALAAGGTLLAEPDRSLNLFSVAPRLMMNLDDVAASGLIQFGARVRYRLLLAGEPAALATWQAKAATQIGRGQRLESIGDARPEIRTALDKAERYLGLATLLTVILSAVAVALAARRYLQRHLDACAILRCLGMTQYRLLRLHLLSFIGLALLALLVGGGLGFLLHFILVSYLGTLVDTALPLPGLRPLLEGGLVGSVLLFGFAFPPLLQLARVPTLRVLRRELGPPAPLALVGHLLGGLLMAMLIFRAAGDLRLGALALGGFAAALLLFWGVARIAVALAASLRRGTTFGWRHGLATLARHGAASTLKIVALGIGLTALLVLGVTRFELVDAWRKSLPPDTPNRFIINIQPAQRTAVEAWLQAAGITAELAPMVRARLVRVNERAISAADFPEDDRAQRLVEREFNLSWRSSLPPGNLLESGRWFAAGASGQGEASVESGLARTLGIRLGDTLVFSVAGVEKPLRVTSLRKLDWDSMRVNFFVVTPPGVLDDGVASYITSFHLPPGDPAFGSRLVAAFPNLTLIDIQAVLAQIETVTGQVVGAVQVVFLLTVLAGVVVLHAAFLSAVDERRHELAVLRALGAPRARLRQALWVELASIGGLAGLIAALAASALGQLLARQIFQLAPTFSLLTPLLVSLACAALTVIIGWLGLRRLIDAPPLAALRQGD